MIRLRYIVLRLQEENLLQPKLLPALIPIGDFACNNHLVLTELLFNKMKRNIFFLIAASAVVIALLMAGFVFLPAFKITANKENTVNGTGQSIAVLPFVNMSNERNQDYFSDGLAEGILNSIARLKGLKVCARTSSFKFRGKDVDIREAGKKLDVNTILEGSVQQHENKVRVTVQLINVADGFHFWSEQYDENIDDVFAIQNKIAEAIAGKLAITFKPGNLPAVTNTTINKNAYDLYLKGRSAWNLGTPAEIKKAIGYFEDAIAIDPLFARAYSGVADCYNTLGYGSLLAPGDAFPKAKKAVIKALALDSTLAEPHASLGFYNFYYEWDWAAAEEEFRRAIALNENYELGYKWYGYYLTAMKRYDEANIVLNKAIELDPLSVPINTDIGFSLYYKGDYDEAIKKLKLAVQMNPKYALAHLWLGRSYQAKKLYAEAISEYNTALVITPGWPVGYAQVGNAYGVSGDTGNGEIILDTLNVLATKKFVTAYGIALVYAGLDNKERAFAWLNKAYEERSNWLVWLRTDPRWTTIRNDKRFAKLVNDVGLPE